MKTTKITAIFLAMIMAGGINLYGQNKESRKKQKKEVAEEIEKRMKEEKEQQQLHEEDLMKVLEETKKIQEEQWERAHKAQLRAMKEAMKDYREQMENMRFMTDSLEFHIDTIGIPDSLRFPGFYFNFSPAWDKFKKDAFMKQRYSIFPGKGKNYIYSYSTNASNMEISKYLKDVDYNNDFTFDVPKGNNNISFHVSGNLSDGKMTITIVKPNGKTLQDFEISPLANISWNHSLSWDEKDQQDYTGIWKITISAKKVTGNYRVSIRSH